MFSYEFVRKMKYGEELLNFGTIIEIDTIENTVTTTAAVAKFEKGKDSFVLSLKNSNKEYTISDCSIFLTPRGLFDTSECKLNIGDEVNYDDQQGTLIGVGYFNLVTQEFSTSRTRLSDSVCALIELSEDETIALMKSSLMISWNSFNFKYGKFKVCKTDLAVSAVDAIECHLMILNGENNEF